MDRSLPLLPLIILRMPRGKAASSWTRLLFILSLPALWGLFTAPAWWQLPHFDFRPAALRLQRLQPVTLTPLSTWDPDACGFDSLHLHELESVADPQQLLEQVVGQQFDSTNLGDEAAAGEPTWLQIGANTMDSTLNSNDPMKALLDSIPTWRKVFVEPIPQLYEQLQQSIQHWPNAVALNYAISPDPLTPESQATMWCYEPALNSSRLGRDLPFWANQICSFNASHISAHFKGQQGVAVAVTAVSLQQLLKRGSISNVQVLMIDAEGFDYAVLQQIPFQHMRPAVVVWERKHLHGDEQAANDLLRSHCYAVMHLDSNNMIAVDVSDLNTARDALVLPGA